MARSLVSWRRVRLRHRPGEQPGLGARLAQPAPPCHHAAVEDGRPRDAPGEHPPRRDAQRIVRDGRELRLPDVELGLVLRPEARRLPGRPVLEPGVEVEEEPGGERHAARQQVERLLAGGAARRDVPGLVGERQTSTARVRGMAIGCDVRRLEGDQRQAAPPRPPRAGGPARRPGAAAAAAWAPAPWRHRVGSVKMSPALAGAPEQAAWCGATASTVHRPIGAGPRRSSSTAPTARPSSAPASR